MSKVVLTADRALFTDYSGVDALGFGLCLPLRLIPKFVEYRILSPPAPAEGVRAAYAPYALSKVEASLIASGFSKDEVIITPPELVEKAINDDTYVVGVHTVDPQGLAPVSWTLRVMTGGGETCTAYEFEKLMSKLSSLKKHHDFKVVVGGPGVWQLRGLEKKFSIDTLFEGEAELTFPEIVREVINGYDLPKYVASKITPPDEIPPIITPSRNGLVQVTRGCPRGCQFCKPTTFFFRSIPLETIVKEAVLNALAGASEISFITEDILLYGAEGLRLNSEAVKKLFDKTFKTVRNYGVKKISFSHVTLSSALTLKEAVKHITEVNSLTKDNPLLPQVGFESGSPRIVAKYFRGKPYPWKPENWPWIVIEGSKLLNNNYWYPCLTYIIGFPDATPEDYVKTTELIDKLKDEGFIGWTFPLFLIPIGGTRIEKLTGFKIFKELPQESVDSFIAGWKLSNKFSRYIYPLLISSIKNPIAKRLVNALINRALDAMDEWISIIKERPESIELEFPQVNIRGLSGILINTTKALLAKSFAKGRKAKVKRYLKSSAA